MDAPLVEAKPAVPSHLSHESVHCCAYVCQFLGVLGWFLVYWAVCALEEGNDPDDPILNFVGASGFFFVIICVAEIFLCKTFQYLGHVCSEADFRKHLARMRGADPSIVFKGKNYVVQYDMSEVDMDKFEMAYEIAGCVDETMTDADFNAMCPGDGGGRSIITMHLPLTVTPADEPTRKHYSDVRTNFADSHKDEKYSQEIKDETTLDGHEEFYLIVMGGDGSVPLWMKRAVFILCSIIPFTTILYRFTLFRLTRSMEIPVTKRFSARSTP